ncbi:MAG: 30S ribosomal protein S19e [Candidatus Altiarchaeota archaeon]|nr:30S ribosomal protein S19e [Candidatus Altiarchaeota archaeon]
MITVAQVSADAIISLIAQDLKTKLEMPEWAKFVKTGPSREKPPTQREWWWIRSASILRRVYLDGPVGSNRLRTYYGGRKDRGVRSEKTYKAGGKIIRTILQQLEKQKLIKSTPKGKFITPSGQSYMDKLAKKASGHGGVKDATESKSTTK